MAFGALVIYLIVLSSSTRLVDDETADSLAVLVMRLAETAGLI